MGLAEGRNAGVSGIIDLPGQSAKFNVWARAWTADLSAAMLDAAGRGDSEWPELRPGSSAGMISVGASVRLDGWPLPSKFRGELGTLTIQQHTGVTIAYPVRVIGETFKKNDKEQGLWDVTLACKLVDDPTAAGFSGTQPTAATESFDDKVLWAGLTTTIDPQGLGSAGTRRLILWGVSDDDASEKTKIDSTLAAISAPFTGLKIRPSTFTRASKLAAYLDVTFGLTDTAEDVVNPQTWTKDDPEDLSNAASVATINATPGTPAGYADRGTTTRELNDSKTLYVKEAGTRTTKEDREFPGSVTNNDPYDLADAATILKVHDTSTSPADPTVPVGQLVERETQQIQSSPGKWQTVWKYGNLNSEQQIEFPAAHVTTDPSALTDEDTQADVTDTSTVPSTPASRFTDGKLRKVISRRVGGTPEKWLHVWEFGRRTTEEDITLPGTVTDDEVSNIADQATITRVTTSATPPSTPAAPVGQLLSIETEQLHNSDGGKWRHTFKYGNTTALQHIQFPTDHQDDDPSDLEDEDHQSDVTATSTPPVTPASRIAGLVLRSTSSVRIAGTPEKWLHRWTFGRRTTEEDITYPGTVTTDETSNIADEATITQVTASGTPPSTPAAPVGQILEIRSERLTDAGKWKHTFRYGNTTALQRIQFPTDTIETDSSALRDEDHQSQTTSTSTVPSAPATRVSGLVLRTVTSQRISGTPELWLHRWFFGRTTTAEDITFPGTVTGDDVGNLEDQATVTQITSSSTPPTTPAAPLGQLVETRSEQLTDAGKWKHTFTFANTTSVQKAQFPHDKPSDDPQNLQDEDVQAQVTTSLTPPTTPAARPTALKLRSITSQRIGGTPAQYLHVWTFGRRNTAEDITIPATITETDVYAIDGSATIRVIAATSTAPTTPAAPLGECVSIETVQIHAGTDGEKWQHTFKYAQINSQQRHTFPQNVANEDPSALRDNETQASIDTSATPPSDPTPAITGLVLRSRWTKQVSGTPAYYLHVWEFGRRSTEQDVTLPGTVTQDETSDIGDHATITRVTSSGTPPTTPAAPVGQILEIRSEQLTAAGKWQHTFTYGNTTDLQRIQFPTDTVETDTSALKDEDRQSSTSATSTVPTTPVTRISGCVLRTVVSRRIAGTPEKWLHQWTFGRRTTEQDVTLPGTVTDDDSSDLRDNATITVVTSSATPPAAPSAPVGLLVSTESEQLTDAGKWRHTFKYANITNAQRLTFPDSPIEDDPSDLGDEEAISSLNSSSTPPATPTPTIIALKLRRRKSVRVSGTPQQWQHTFYFARTNAEDDVEMPATVTGNDISDLSDKATICVVTASATPAAAPTAPVGQHVETTTTQLHDTRWKHVYRYANNTNEQDVTFAGSFSEEDASDLSEIESVRYVQNGSTPPATPTPTIAGLVLRSIRSQRIGGTPEKWQHTFIFGRRTTEQDITLPGTTTADDASDLRDEKRITIVDDSTPVAPSTPAGYKLAETIFEQLTDAGRWKYEYVYKRRTNQEAIEFDDSLLDTDPSALADKQTITQIQATSVATATPPSTPSGLVLRSKSSVQIHAATTGAKWRNRYEYTRRTTAEDVTFPGTITTDDQSDIADEATITIIDDITPVAPSTPSGMKLVDIRQEQLTDAGQYQWTYKYARRTRQEAIEFDNSEVKDDSSDIADTQTIVLVQSTAAGSAPSTPSGLKLVDKISVQIHDASTGAKWRNEWKYARRSREDDVEMGGTQYAVDQSGNVVGGSARVTVVEADATPDGGVTVSGLTLRDIEKKQIHDTKWEITYVFGQSTREDEIELEGTDYLNDPSNLADRAQVTLLNTSSTYPVGLDTPPTVPTTGTLKLRGVRSKKLTITSGVWQHTGIYGLTTEQDDVQFAASSVTDDASDLADEQITAVVTASATPVDPGAPSGLKLRETKTKQLNDGKWLHAFHYARTNREDDEEFDAYFEEDVSALERGGLVVVINATLVPPSTPATPVTGAKFISLRTQQLTDAKWKHTFKYAERTPQEDIEWLQSRAMVETGELERRPITVAVTGSATAGAGTNPDSTNLSLYSSTSHQVGDAKWVHVFEWRPLTSTESMDAEHTEDVTDPGTFPLGTKARECIVDTNVAAPTAPTVTGLVCFEVRTVRVGKVKYRHDYSYRYRTNQDDLTAEKTRTATDPQALEHEAVTAEVWDNTGSEPATPTAPLLPVGLKLTEKLDLTTPNPKYTIRVYRWALLDSADRIVFPRVSGQSESHGLGTPITTDASIIAITTDIPTTAAAQYASRRGTATFGGLRLKKLTSTKALLEVDTITDTILIADTVDTNWKYHATTGSNVIVSQVVQLDTSLWLAYTTPYLELTEDGVILIRRRIVATSYNDTLTKESLRGLVNDASFLGYNAGTVLFAGHRILNCYADQGSARVFDVLWRCNYCSHGWINDSEVDHRRQHYLTSNPGIGQEPASTFGWSVTGATSGSLVSLIT